MEKSKICIRCGVNQPLTDYYKHKQMSDGHLNKCKECTKSDTRKREEILLSTPEGREKEKARHRNKYHRLGYREKHKPTYDQKKATMDRYKAKFPEKIVVRNLTSHIKSDPGMNNHHWSYNEEHALDFIPLSIEDHNIAHRWMEYDQERRMYRTAGYSLPGFENNELLDTRERHERYINALLNK